MSSEPNFYVNAPFDPTLNLPDPQDELSQSVQQLSYELAQLSYSLAQPSINYVFLSTDLARVSSILSKLSSDLSIQIVKLQAEQDEKDEQKNKEYQQHHQQQQQQIDLPYTLYDCQYGCKKNEDETHLMKTHTPLYDVSYYNVVQVKHSDSHSDNQPDIQHSEKKPVYIITKDE